MDEGLAQLFQAYIDHDFQVASGAQADKAVLQHQLKAAIEAAVKTHRAEQKSQTGGAREVAGRAVHAREAEDVHQGARHRAAAADAGQAGATTTMYVENVLALIKSAKKRLYIQMQYVHPTSLPADRSFMRSSMRWPTPCAARWTCA